MPYVVVAYDIPDDPRRLRLARALWGMLDRVQKSVFEGELEEPLQERLEERKLSNLVPLCGGARRRCAKRLS